MEKQTCIKCRKDFDIKNISIWKIGCNEFVFCNACYKLRMNELNEAKKALFSSIHI